MSEKLSEYEVELNEKRRKAINALIDVLLARLENAASCMARDDFTETRDDFEYIAKIATRCRDLCLAGTVRATKPKATQ